MIIITRSSGCAALRSAAYYESQSMAITRMETIAREEEIDCDFARLDGYLILAPGCDPRMLECERTACRRIGFEEVEWADPPAMTMPGPALRFPGQARMHPLKYLAGLARAIEARGGRSSPTRPSSTSRRRTGACAWRRRTAARCAPRSRSSPPIRPSTTASRSTRSRRRTAPMRSPRASPTAAVPDALYWDTLDPYHYVRLQPGSGGRAWLIFGGEDHKTGEADDFSARFGRLEAWTRQYFPMAGEVVHRWSGQVMEPVDGAPFIGRNHGNQRIFVVTGDSGEGMTSGAVAGMLLVLARAAWLS